MKRIRTIIADDEKPARDRLKLALAGMIEIELIGEAVNGAEAVRLIRDLKPQLAFLDVQMPVMNGFEAISHCKDKPFVIFTTAFDEYALQAFEVHAIDYLLKPYGKDRLRAAVDHAVERIGSADGTNGSIPEYRKLQPYWTRINLRQGRSYKIAAVDKVDFFKAEDGLVFWVENDQRLMVDETLNELEENLDPARFLRAHRSAIVNLGKIERVISLGRGRCAAEFPGGARVEVGRTKLDVFRRAMSLRR